MNSARTSLKSSKDGKRHMSENCEKGFMSKLAQIQHGKIHSAKKKTVHL